MSRSDVQDDRASTAGEPVRGHAFDGIEEYDNPMPGWWKAIFWLTVAFSVPYFFYYEIGVGEGVDAAYQRDLGEFYEAQAAKLGDLKPDEATIVALSHDPKMQLAGQALFRSNCAVCHGASGGGNGVAGQYGLVAIASFHQDRLRDMADGEIYNTITHGKNTMLGYGSKIPVDDRWAIVAYVRALQAAQTATINDVPPEERTKLETPPQP